MTTKQTKQRHDIDEAFLSTLVDAFYTKVRADEHIGPIFDRTIGDNWDVHLARMKDFWSSVALRSGKYSGRPVPKHLALTDARPEHFEIWLRLFEETLAETAPNREAAALLLSQAQRIARSLTMAMFSWRGGGRRLPMAE